jgi:hypothetical protein
MIFTPPKTTAQSMTKKRRNGVSTQSASVPSSIVVQKRCGEFGRIPRGKEELEMLRERYLRVFVERERSGIEELRYATNADEVEDEELRKVAKRYWERDWNTGLQYAGVGIEEMWRLGFWEGFDGVGVVDEEEEEEEEDGGEEDDDDELEEDDDEEESEDPNDSDYVDEFDEK